MAPQTLALTLVLLAIAVVHLVNLNGWPVFFDDEGTYTAQAWAGLRGSLAHYTYWYDHPPLGWLQLSAITAVPSLLGADLTVGGMRHVMVLFTVVTAALIHRLARNLGVSPVAALLTTALWGLSPLVVFEGRQVMLDNLALPWVVGAFVLVTGPRCALWRQLLAGGCLGVAVLTKETAVLVAPGLLLALWTYAYRPTRSFGLVGSTMLASLIVGAYPLFALLKFELLAGPDHVSLQSAIEFQLLDRVGSGSVLDGTSIARGVVDSWLLHDPVLPVLGAVAGVGCLAVRRLRPVGVVVAVMLVVALRPDGYMPLMYVIGFLPFAALGVGALGDVVVTAARRVRPGGVPVGALAAALVVAAAVTSAAPGWWSRQTLAHTEDSNAPYRAALDHVEASLPVDTRILVDDTYWTDLVGAGWSPDGWNGPIWYFKLDLDPVARDENLPGGWTDVDYILVNAVMLQNLATPGSLPEVEKAYDASVVVAEWGEGTDQVQLRQVRPSEA